MTLSTATSIVIRWRRAGDIITEMPARRGTNWQWNTHTHAGTQHTPHNTCNGVCVGNGNALVLRCKQKLFSLRKAVKAPRSHTPPPLLYSPLLYTSRFPLCFAKLRLSNWKSLRQLTGTRQACVPSFPALTALGSAVVQHQQNSRECGMNGMERGSVKL